MPIRPKTKRRVMILGLAFTLLCAAGTAVYLRYLQKRNADMAAWRAAAMSAYAAGDYAAALPHFSKYLTESKTADRPRGKADTEALFAYGKSRASVIGDNRHLWEARGIFERYLVLSPGDLEAEHMLLDLYPRLNMNAEAVNHADEVLARHPDDVKALKARTKALIQKGMQQDPKSLAEAVTSGERLNKVAPLDLEGQLLTQYALVATKRPPEEVVARAEELLEQHPQDPRFELVLASAHLYANRLDKAREWLTTAAGRTAPDEQFVTELVTRLDALAMFKQSQEVLERAAAEFGGNLSLTRAAVQRQWQSGRQEAVAQRLASLDPGSAKSDAALLGLRALSLYQLGRAESAKPVVDALASRGASDSVAFAWSTALRARFADPAPAPRELVEKYKAALEKDPGNAVIHQLRGEALARLGENTLAIDAWSEAARRAPSWAIPRAEVAVALAAEGRFADAVRAAEDAFHRSRENVGIVIVWARAAFELLETMPDQKELNRLLRTVEEIQQFRPGEPHTLPIYASVLARSGRREDAAKVVRAALESPKPPSAQVVARLAGVSRDNALGLDDLIAEKLRGRIAEGGPWAALGGAMERLDAGKPADGLALLIEARDKAASDPGGAGDALDWQLATARYLDLINDPTALGQWVMLGDSNPKDLRVQSAVLRARCRQRDREFWKRTIDRVKQLTVENSQLAGLEEAKFLLTGPLVEKDRAKVLATLNELVRNAPYSAEPHRLLAIANELAAAGTASSQSQQASLRAAADEMAKASDLRPADVGIVAELSRLLRAVGRPDEIIRYLDRAAASPALERPARLVLAELYAQHGQLPRAVELASPLGADAASRLARWHQALGQTQQAVDLYNNLLGEKVLDAQTVLDGATFFADQNQPQRAEEFLKRLDGIEGLQPGARELVRAKFYERTRSEEAGKWYAAAAAAPKASAGVWRELAGFHLRQRRFGEAVATAEQGLKAHPADPDLQAMRARARDLEPLAQDRAILPLLGFLSFDPRNGPAVEMLTILRETHGSNPAARDTAERLREAAERHGNFLPLQAAAVRGLLRSGELQKAEVVARRAAATFPDDVEAVRLLAAVYSAAGKWAELRDAAQTWRRLTPQNPADADLVLARAMLNLNEAPAAAERLRPYAEKEAAKGDAAAPEILDLYARALIAQAKSDEAAAVLEPLAKNSAAWRRLWLELAGSFRTRDLETAAGWVARVEPYVSKDAPQERRDLAAAWYVVGREFGDKESLRNARGIAEPLTRLDAKDLAAEAWTVMASCDEALGELDAAEREYRAALALRPSEPSVQNNLAYVLLLKGQPAQLEEALDLSTAAITASPTVSSFHDTLARIHARRGDTGGAIDSFKAALSLDPGSMEAMVGLADVLSQSGRREEAKAQLAQIDDALRITPRLPATLQTQLESIRANLKRQIESGRAE